MVISNNTSNKNRGVQFKPLLQSQSSQNLLQVFYCILLIQSAACFRVTKPRSNEDDHISSAPSSSLPSLPNTQQGMLHLLGNIISDRIMENERSGRPVKRGGGAIPIADFAMDTLYNMHVANQANSALQPAPGNTARSFVGRRSEDYLQMPLYSNVQNGVIKPEDTYLDDMLVSLYGGMKDNNMRDNPFHSNDYLGYNQLKSQSNDIYSMDDSRVKNKRDDLNIADYAADLVYGLNNKNINDPNLMVSKSNRAFIGKRAKPNVLNTYPDHLNYIKGQNQFAHAFLNKAQYHNSHHSKGLKSKKGFAGKRRGFNEMNQNLSPRFLPYSGSHDALNTLFRDERRKRDHSIADFASDVLLKQYEDINKPRISDRSGMTFIGKF